LFQSKGPFFGFKRRRRCGGDLRRFLFCRYLSRGNPVATPNDRIVETGVGQTPLQNSWYGGKFFRSEENWKLEGVLSSVRALRTSPGPPRLPCASTLGQGNDKRG